MQRALSLTWFVLMLPSLTNCLSSRNPPSRSRRNLLNAAVVGVSSSIFCVSNNNNNNIVVLEPAVAACLRGDLSKECIGVYKVPMDDAISGMVGTKEALERNAPGLNYVPPVTMPQSVADALQQLEAQRKAADDIRSVVSGGRLEEAGIKVLNLIPKVTAAGRVVVATVAQSSSLSGGAKEVQLLKLQSKLDETLGYFGAVDVSIGQGIRGEMGVVTVAQLIILSDLKDAIIAFDEFLDQIPR